MNIGIRRMESIFRSKAEKHSIKPTRQTKGNNPEIINAMVILNCVGLSFAMKNTIVWQTLSKGGRSNQAAPLILSAKSETLAWA
jgi:hypothetical protein